MGNYCPVIVIDRQTTKQRQLSRQMGRDGSLLFSTDDVVGAVVFGVRSLQRYPVISLHKRSHFTSKPTSRTRLEAASVNNLNRHKFKISPTPTSKQKVDLKFQQFLTWSEVTSVWSEVTFVWREVTLIIMERSDFWLGLTGGEITMGCSDRNSLQRKELSPPPLNFLVFLGRTRSASMGRCAYDLCHAVHLRF